MDIVSAGELARAIAAGIKPSDVVFSGVGKTNDEIRQALAYHIGQINAESPAEVAAISAIAKEMDLLAPVALRVNVDVVPLPTQKFQLVSAIQNLVFQPTNVKPVISINKWQRIRISLPRGLPFTLAHKSVIWDRLNVHIPRFWLWQLSSGMPDGLCPISILGAGLVLIMIPQVQPILGIRLACSAVICRSGF